MNYFDQISIGAESNIKLLLGNQNTLLNDTTKKALFKRNVEIINLELSYQCNRKCDYCPVSNSSRQNNQNFMPLNLLKKICHELKEIRYENRISLNLYNEPLLDKNLEEKIEEIKTQLPYCHIAFNSNGDKITYKRVQSLSDAGCNYICITLHPPPNKIQSIATIKKRLEKIYSRLNLPPPKEFAFANCNQIMLRVCGMSIKIQWPNWRIKGNNRGGILSNHISMKSIRTQPCAKPFREFTIFYDGNVQPCCESFHDDKINLVSIGNTNEATIFEIYSSKFLSDFRRHVFDFSPKKGICEFCSVIDYSNRIEDHSRKMILSKIQPEQ